MKLDAEALTAGMHKALLLRSESGPTADPALELRVKPRASGCECARQAFYRMTGAPTVEREAWKVAATQQGQDLEAGVLDDFEWTLLTGDAENPALDPRATVQRQVKMQLPWVTGTCDMLVTLSDGERLIPDSKTMNRDAFEIGLREGMKAGYRRQLSIYAHGLDAQWIATLARNTDCREKRGKPSPGVYRVALERRDDAQVAEAQTIALQAMEARRFGQESMAPRAFTRDHWLCRPDGWCDFREHCWRKA